MNQPKRKKIAIVLASRGQGGLERHFVDLCNGLVDHVDVVAIAHPEFRPQIRPEVRLEPLTIRRSRRNPLLLLELVRLLRRERFDLVHAHANKAVALVGTIRKLLDPPLLGTLHNQKPDVHMFHRMHHVIAVSRHVAELVHHPDATVVYNGARPLEVKRMNLKEAFNLPPRNPVVVAVGRLVKAKGFDVLIDAMAGTRISAIIVGGGPDENLLRSKIKQHKLENQVRLAGFRNDVPTLLAAADGVVISSRKEGFSYVTAEALLVGARLLATNVPVANEILSEHLIVPTEDARALRDRLLSLVDDVTRWDELIEPAHTFAREKLTFASMIRQTVDVYRRLIEQREAAMPAAKSVIR